MKVKTIFTGVVLLLGLNVQAHAEEWCEFEPGFSLVTNGTQTDNVWINAPFKGLTVTHWINLKNEGTGAGQNNVALALAAQMAGKGVKVYLNGATDTCDTIPKWYSDIRHLEIIH